MKNPIQSLPARIVFFVFAATLLTSLTVTAVSVNSIDSFLREKIDQKFPQILQTTEEKIDIWYDRRLRELAVFAQSHVLQSNLEEITARSARHQRGRARSEIQEYIAYVLAHFPQYSGLFLLDTEGKLLLSAGEIPALSEVRLKRFAALDSERVSSVSRSGTAGPFQIVSSPLRDPHGKPRATLNAVLPLVSLRPILTAKGVDPSARMLVLDAKGRYLIDNQTDPNARVPNRASVTPPPASELSSYHDEKDERVVGRSLEFSRFGWMFVVEQPYARAFAPVIATIGHVLIINLAVVVLAGLAAFRVATSIARPIEALSAAARRISDGEESVITPEDTSSDEVAVLTRAFNDMTMRLTNNARELQTSHLALADTNRELHLRNEELQEANEILEQLSITDGLTKLHNHRYFQELLQRESNRAERTGKPLSLILIDIDYFKRWNDHLGHAAGDSILRQLADTMNSLVRETDTLARYGGEEFALIAPATALEGAAQLAEKIRNAISQIHPDPDSTEASVTVSIGVAGYAGDRRALFGEADRALYRAKSSGRDCVMVSNAAT